MKPKDDLWIRKMWSSELNIKFPVLSHNKQISLEQKECAYNEKSAYYKCAYYKCAYNECAYYERAQYLFENKHWTWPEEEKNYFNITFKFFSLFEYLLKRRRNATGGCIG